MAFTKTTKTYTRRSRRYKKKPAKVSKSIQKYVKKAITKDKELYRIDDSAVENSASTLASPWWLDLMMYRAQRLNEIIGVDATKVESVGLSIKYFIHNNNTANNATHIRLLVLETKVTADTGYRAGTDLFELQAYNSTASGNRSYNATTYDLVTRINDEKYKVHYDKIVSVGAVGASAVAQNLMNDVHGKIWIPFRKVMKFEESASGGYPINGHLAFVAIPIEGNNDVSLGQVLEVSAVGTWFFRH